MRSDVVSLHVPLTSATVNLIDSRRLRLMKPGSILINAARGGVVDEKALAEAVESGRLFGAGLDTFDSEPLGAEAAVSRDSRILLSPHIAGVTPQSALRMSMGCAENISCILLKGRCSADLVNPDWRQA